MKLVTVKQLKLIEQMEQLLSITFKGKTLTEASQFISKHMDDYQEKKEFVFDMTHNLDHY